MGQEARLKAACARMQWLLKTRRQFSDSFLMLRRVARIAGRKRCWQRITAFLSHYFLCQISALHNHGKHE